jgi:integrase
VLDPWLEHQHSRLTGAPAQSQLAASTDAQRQARDRTFGPLHKARVRYTFAMRAIELGLDWQTIESIVGHRAADMAHKYTAKRQNAPLAIVTLDRAKE